MKASKLACGVLASSLAFGIFAATPSFDDFDQRARNGENLTVAFFGGSLTWGARASDPQKTSYRAIIGRKLEEKYPKAHFKFIDAAIGGTGSQLGVFRLQRDVLAYKPDLVFLDFTLNDDVYKTTPDTLAAYESLVRRIIAEGNCPVIQMFLAARSFVTDGNTEKMKRYHANMAIAKAYNTASGDAITLMQEKYKKGQLDLDKVWPAASFDTCHPDDPGYALYAEAGWNAYLQAVTDKLVCRVPEKMLNSDAYMHWTRVRISSLAPLPQGWKTTFASRDYCAFDFLMSRWLDDVTAAANFIAIDRTKTKLAPAALPLKLKFTGSSLLLFGESSPRSCKYRVTIDGKEKDFNACQLGQSGIGRMWQAAAEGLDPVKEHTLEIKPLFDSPDKPQELRLESICAAGSVSAGIIFDSK
jgi:lysophospholipase L1-like esterase